MVTCRLQSQAGGLKKASFCRTMDNANVRTGEVFLRGSCVSIEGFASWLTFLGVLSTHLSIIEI